MRLFEFASAEEQLALWKLISNSVWTAIEQQVQQQQQERAATKGKGKRRKAVAPVAVALTPPATPQRQTVQQQPTDAAAVAGSPNTAFVGARAEPNAAAARAVDDENAAAVADDDEATAANVSQKIPQKRQKTGITPNKGS